MTPAPWQGEQPRSRVRHGWRCVRRGPVLEVVRRLPNGEALVVSECGECHGDDLVDRLRAESAEPGGPT
jgi:hypothetical protein